MTSIAIIPARAGSKRIPKKNIRRLGNQPLIAWTIEAAHKSNVFDYVIVSTDSEEIKDIAIAHGAQVPFLRPKELATDIASSESVIHHAVESVESLMNIDVTTITLLQPTSPFRNENHIKESFDLFNNRKADGVIGLGESKLYQEFSNILPPSAELKDFITEQNKRTQESSKLYFVNGSIYIFKRCFSGKMFELYSRNSHSYAYIMDEIASLDIDDEKDFLWAEFLLKNKNDIAEILRLSK